MGKRKKLELLQGSILEQISRRAKYLIFEFQGKDDRYYIVNHLSMTGTWLLRKGTFVPIHSRLVLHFENAIVDFIDIRKWGRLDVYTQNEFFTNEKLQTKLGNLGPDTLNEEISADYLLNKLKEQKDTVEIKPLLMDQTFLSGIGNIYASEICFLAGVNPFRKANSLAPEEIANLQEAIPLVIKNAYETGGSTIRTYKTPDGSKGFTQHVIYGQKFCKLCKSRVSKGPQQGRTTFWCPKCQGI